MNLYLYIPPMSVHPPNMLKGLIFGCLWAYWKQTTDKDDFLHFATLLGKRLIAWGWPKTTVIPLMQESMNRLNTMASMPMQTKQKPIIFHLPFHPWGIQQQTIRDIYNKTVRCHIKDRPLIVAVSCPRNLHDRLCKTKLADIDGKNPSNYLNQGGDPW